MINKATKVCKLSMFSSWWVTIKTLRENRKQEIDNLKYQKVFLYFQTWILYFMQPGTELILYLHIYEYGYKIWHMKYWLFKFPVQQRVKNYFTEIFPPYFERKKVKVVSWLNHSDTGWNKWKLGVEKRNIWYNGINESWEWKREISGIME